MQLNIDSDTMQKLTLLAGDYNRTPEEVLVDVVQQYWERRSFVDLMKSMHKKMLDERGGIPFSDSVEIIREMRDND